MATITKTAKTEIAQPVIYRVTDKQTHQVFFLVKSDTQEHTYYEVRWNEERLCYCCNCPARCTGCKHSRAIAEVQVLRRAAEARLQAIEERHAANLAETLPLREAREIGERGNLNGNRGFQLMR